MSTLMLQRFATRSRSALAAQAHRRVGRSLCSSLEWTTLDNSGLRLRDLHAPEAGRTAREGDVVSVHFTGRLEDGTTFDTSLDENLAGNQVEFEGIASSELMGWDRGIPVQFTLGGGEVIPGWDGVHGMRVGGRRMLIVPPELGYGDKGSGDTIPPDAVLHFEIEVLDIRDKESVAKGPVDDSLWTKVSKLWSGA